MTPEQFRIFIGMLDAIRRTQEARTRAAVGQEELATRILAEATVLGGEAVDLAQELEDKR